MSKAYTQVTFAFRRGHTIGDIAAETDKLLEAAFVDTGDLQTIQDTRNSKSIIVGRVGTGKTALLLRLKAGRQRVIELDPAALSLRYLSNTTIVPQLTRLGVHLEPFYQLLWRHVLVMELIRDRFNLRESDGGGSLFERLSRVITMNSSKKKALEYYTKWNPEFWEETSVRVREITKTFQDTLKAQLGASYAGIAASLGAGDAVGETERTELVQRIQPFVSEISLEHIQTGLDILREHVLADEQKPYYIVIDDLDKNWIDAAYAYDLIEALVEVVGDFARLPNVKIVVALRENILEALLSRRGKQKQQREKVERLCLRLHWSARDLVSIVDGRLKELLRGVYGGDVTLETLLPPRVRKDGPSATEYVVERTFKRPRDIIDFVNRCIEGAAAAGKQTISWNTIQAAERAYSKGRLRSVEDEWYDNYGSLTAVLHAFEGAQDGFTISELHDDVLLGIFLDGDISSDPLSLSRIAFQLHQANRSEREIWTALMPHLFKIGLVGVKRTPEDPIVFWYDRPEIAEDTYPDGVRFYLHPALHEALRVKSSQKGHLAR